MGNDRDDLAATFDTIETHLRAKGHRVRRDDANEHLHLACSGVTIDHPAGGGIFVTAVTAHGRDAVLAALADLDAQVPALDEIRGTLAATTPVAPAYESSWLSWVDIPDCTGCDPCDLIDLAHLSHCDAPDCDLPGCDLC